MDSMQKKTHKCQIPEDIHPGAALCLPVLLCHPIEILLENESYNRVWAWKISDQRQRGVCVEK